MPCNLNSWTLRTSPVTKEWFSVAFGEGSFVAVANASGGADANMVITSEDNGVTWTQRTTPGVAMEWTSVWHDGTGRFVACAESDQGGGQCMFSTDKGVSWTFATSGSSFNNWSAGTYDTVAGKHVCVARGNPNRCITSSNGGVAWTHRAIQDEAWRGVYADHGVVIAVGDNAVSSSTDGGVNWTARTPASSNNWQSVTYASWLGMWVAVSNTGTGNRVMTSSNDGVTWTSRTSASDANWIAITNTGFRLVAVSQGSVDIQHSDDGVNWTLASGARSQNWHGITFGNDTVVAVALSGVADAQEIETATCTNAVTLSLSGVSGTSALGSMLAAGSLALSGVSAAGSVGSLVGGQPLVGVAALGAAGSLAPSVTLALSGVAATGAINALSVSGAFVLSGVAGTGAAGSLAVSDTVALVGAAGIGAVGSLGVVVDVNVTVALSGVLGTGAVGSLVASGGSFPALPFNYQLLMDGPRFAILRVAPNIDVDLPVSLLVDPQNLASIIPGWPSGPKASRLAIERVQYSTPAALVLDIWWAGPVPVLALTVNGTEDLDFSAKGGLQNNAAGTAGQILLSTRGLSGNQSFSLTLKLVKQGSFG